MKMQHFQFQYYTHEIRVHNLDRFQSAQVYVKQKAYDTANFP